MNQQDQETKDAIYRLANEIMSGGQSQRAKINDLISMSSRFEYMTPIRNPLVRALKRFDGNKQAAAKERAWDKAMHYVYAMGASASMRSP
jgi:hypothetical protein